MRTWVGRAERSSADLVSERAGLVVQHFQADFSLLGEVTQMTSPAITTPIDCILRELVVTVAVPGPGFALAVKRDAGPAWDTTVGDNQSLVVYPDLDLENGASTRNVSQWQVVFGSDSTAADINVSMRFETEV